MSQPGARTPEELARYVVQQIAPGDLDAVETVSAEFFGAGDVRNRIAGAVLGGTRRPTLTGFDPITADLLIQSILVVLVGISTNIISGQLERTAGDVRRRLWRRRTRKAIAGPVAARARAAPVPTFGPADLDRLLVEIDEVVRHVGMPDDQRSAVLTILGYVLADRNGKPTDPAASTQESGPPAEPGA